MDKRDDGWWTSIVVYGVIYGYMVTLGLLCLLPVLILAGILLAGLHAW